MPECSLISPVVSIQCEQSLSWGTGAVGFNPFKLRIFHSCYFTPFGSILEWNFCCAKGRCHCWHGWDDWMGPWQIFLPLLYTSKNVATGVGQPPPRENLPFEPVQCPQEDNCQAHLGKLPNTWRVREHVAKCKLAEWANIAQISPLLQLVLSLCGWEGLKSNALKLHK